MKDSWKVGLQTTTRITVDRPRTIDFLGETGRVYATPELVRDVEITCRGLLLEHSQDSEDSVGTRMELDHLAATPLGMWVEITATVVEVDGRRCTLEFVARDPVETVARGRHGRAVVNPARLAERLQGKLALAGQT
jgi:fluoroacetyl-CoA thioesterase